MMEYCNIFEEAAEAARYLAGVDNETISRTLVAVADAVEAASKEILAANAQDLSHMDPDSPLRDRLLLTTDRIAGIASDMRHVASLPSPLGEIIDEWSRPNGMKIKKVRVPLGVIGVIYEARPNVGFDVFSLCFKSGNSCILKGGHEALESNKIAVSIIRTALEAAGINPSVVTLLPSEHEATDAMLKAVGKVDLVIPRGSRRLIDFVRGNAKVPVIETGAGICHAYFDVDGDLTKGKAIITNAKTRRVSVCNALDSLIIHSSRLTDLSALLSGVAAKNVIVYADERAYSALSGAFPENLLQHADTTSFGTEFLDYKMSVKTVDSLGEAVDHIALYGSKHSESIITENPATAAIFERNVDAACVYWNLPTSFTDGGQFGFGAEIGISTQKMHARGPMGLREITTYKYIIEGDGQIRN
jgi:glutamate-5-semialdehyde dehydrogenase